MKIKKQLLYLVLVLVCIFSSSCQKTEPMEVILRPTNTPASMTVTATPVLTEGTTEESLAPEIVSSVETEQPTQMPTTAPSEEAMLTPVPTTSAVPQIEKAGHFFVEQESQEIRKLFDYIYGSILEHEQKVELPQGAKRSQVERVMWLLNGDCPELYWFSHISEYRFMESEPDVIIGITLDYLLSKDEAEKAAIKIQEKINSWIAETEGLSVYEKELYVHDAIIKGCKYANSSDHDGTVYGALVRGQARCEGYANAMNYVMRYMGVECATLSGKATNESGTESHAWNMVKIDGKWTLIDLTWDDPEGRDLCLYAYCNVTNAMLDSSHMTDNEFDRYDLPECTNSGLNYCVKNDCYVSADTDPIKALTVCITEHLKGEGKGMLRFETKQQYDQALNKISDCLQAAVEKTGIYPEKDSLRYVTIPDANYIHFE